MYSLRIFLLTLVVAQFGGNALFAQPKAPVAAAVTSLANTEWTGTEDLAGYGKLTFQFGTGADVTMIDAKATDKGRYSIDRDTVTLSFGGGNVVYTGKLKGNILAGEALDTNFKPWKFSVTRKGVAVAVAPKIEKAPKFDPPAPKVPVKAEIVKLKDTGKLTAEKLPEVLRKLGYKVEVVPTEIGVGYCLVSVAKDGWTFDIEVTVNSTGGIWLTAPLVDVSREKIAAGKLLNILEANATIGPCFFSYRSADGKLCMRLEVGGGGEAAFPGDLNLLTNQIRATYDLWK